ncbi:MAG: serpin family protein, partial [Planctomycetia bacterium]|nr:serpin family protein [Planctomycetia bacterium]
EVLSALGMGIAFGLEADFAGMTGKKNFHLSAVMHKAYVSVHEDGTEAAAATASFVERSLDMPQAFRADHPFVFLLRDTRTGCILFLGRLVSP